MSSPVAERAARKLSVPRPPAAGAAAPEQRSRSRTLPLVVICCVALAALSLLATAQPTYDPWSWLIWGREIAHGTLTTTTGPSWKPLPVLFTTLFSLAGDSAAPLLWLVVARAGGLLAVAMVFRLASRLAGRGAGVVAAVSLVLADEFLRNATLGNSEGLLVAIVLLAVERHLDEHPGQAFALGFAAALLRPELWPFWGLYGLWLADREPLRRRAVAAAFAAIPLLWLVPEWLGSGDLLRAAARAREPRPESAAFAPHPFLEVFQRASHLLIVPVLVLAAVAIGGALARRVDARRLLLAFATAAATLLVTVALMTQFGFSGNLRYVELPAALVCVLAGAGWALLVRAAEARFGLPAAVAAAILLLAAATPFAIARGRLVDSDAHWVHREAQLYDQIPQALAIAGGRRAIDACGLVYTGPFEVPALAWALHRRFDQVTIFPAPPGTVIAGRILPLARDARFQRVGSTQRWVIRRACG